MYTHKHHQPACSERVPPTMNNDMLLEGSINPYKEKGRFSALDSVSAEKENVARSCPIYVSKWKTHSLDLTCLIQVIISALKTYYLFFRTENHIGLVFSELKR